MRCDISTACLLVWCAVPVHAQDLEFDVLTDVVPHGPCSREEYLLRNWQQYAKWLIAERDRVCATQLEYGSNCSETFQARHPTVIQMLAQKHEGLIGILPLTSEKCGGALLQALSVLDGMLTYVRVD